MCPPLHRPLILHGRCNDAVYLNEIVPHYSLLTYARLKFISFFSIHKVCDCLGDFFCLVQFTSHLSLVLNYYLREIRRKIFFMSIRTSSRREGLLVADKGHVYSREMSSRAAAFSARYATRSHEDLTGGATDCAFLRCASCTTGGRNGKEETRRERERDDAREREYVTKWDFACSNI